MRYRVLYDRPDLGLAAGDTFADIGDVPLNVAVSFVRT